MGYPFAYHKWRDCVNYYGAKELAESFRVVRRNTVTIAEDLPEDRYPFRPTPETRTVGELLAHIALSYNFQYQVHAVERRSSLEGFDFPAFRQRLMAEERIPRSKDQTLAMLQRLGETWATWVDGLTEPFLGERVHFGGPHPGSKTRFEMVLSVKEHENAPPRPADADRAYGRPRAASHACDGRSQRCGRDWGWNGTGCCDTLISKSRYVPRWLTEFVRVRCTERRIAFVSARWRPSCPRMAPGSTCLRQRSRLETSPRGEVFRGPTLQPAERFLLSMKADVEWPLIWAHRC